MILSHKEVHRSSKEETMNKRGDKFSGGKGGKFERKQRNEKWVKRKLEVKLSTTRHTRGPRGER